MRIVLQRVKKARVTIDSNTVGAINQGILILLGIHMDDTREMADFLAAKCADLRIFSDERDKMNLSLRDIGGEALVVSQFTLFGDCSRGRRPSFIEAAPPEKGKALYEYFVKKMKEQVKKVETGVFGAMMEVELVNDGPVTLIIDK
ncbi:MAG: D-tyrosyl-tRNA(Tyr) deacylase [Chitinispirillaceae bacterium]|nr:D-tyrosyl-tRNA(Tyr) deacylase [Chitinispirillaceae bacterium]